MQGTFKAVAREWHLGVSQTGKEHVAVLFEIIDGEHAGKKLTWRGFFTENTTERTLDSLRYCGWSCDNLAALTGMGSADVDIVVEEEMYEGKLRDKVQWVNKPASLSMKGAMDPAAAAAFAAKMRGAALRHKQKNGGAVAAPAAARPPAQQRPASNGQRKPAHGAADYDAPDTYEDVF